MRGVARLLLLFALLAAYVVHSSAGALLLRSRERRLRFHAAATSFWAKLMAWLLGFHVHVKGREYLPTGGRTLLVSNHMGYLDIMVLSSILPTLYVTSTDIQRTFFLGLISTLGGSLFVDRRSKSRLLHDIAQIVEVLNHGLAVTLFPEGTSSNGEQVLPFKNSLFAVAEREGFAVAPLCISYHTLAGERVTPDNRDRLYYYGDISFFPHMLGVPWVAPVEVTVEFLPAFDAGHGLGRKEIAQRCYGMISETYARQHG